jgi:double-stranded uracil-DNA glycosylase
MRKPTPAQVAAAAGRTIPDVIGPDLRVLFSGINPSLYSAATGHHFARPGNRFWPVLHKSGFTARQLHPAEQSELPAVGLGITNVVARATARADELSPAELVSGGAILRTLVEHWRPGYLAVLGVTAFRAAFGRKRATIGPQPEPLGGVPVWVLPNPSGLNASYQMDRLAEEFARLREAAFEPGSPAGPPSDPAVADAPDPDCWLHPDVEVRSSSIAGKGLFATAAIPAGTVVSRLGGRLVSGRELRELLATADHYIDTITVGEDVHLVLPPRRPNGYGNHSCDPNLWWVSAYELATRTSIRPGDELTSDYAAGTTEPGFVMPCACGSPLCRHTVTGDDWRRPDLQARYGDHWIPAILRRRRR